MFALTKYSCCFPQASTQEDVFGEVEHFVQVWLPKAIAIAREMVTATATATAREMVTATATATAREMATAIATAIATATARKKRITILAGRTGPRMLLERK
jgi:hypothetical protein